MKILPLTCPARPFFAKLFDNGKSYQIDLRDHTGKLWTAVNGWTYSEVIRKAETAAFGFGGTMGLE